MKRGLARSLALALALALLAGCEMFVPAPTERPPYWWVSAEPTGSTEPSPSQAVWQEGSGTDFDRRFAYSKFCVTGDTVYFSPFNSHLIYYADKATGICLPLCGKPECRHNDEKCNAYIGSSGLYGLANYNGRLYWVGHEKIMDRWKYCIVSMAYDGTDRRIVRELTDWAEANYSMALTRLMFHRGYIYKCYASDEVVDGEAKTIARVTAFSVEDDRAAFEILGEEIALNHTNIEAQAYGDYVYIGLKAIDGALAVYRWDTRVGALETLYRGTAPFYWDEQFWATEDGLLLGSRVYPDPEGNPEAWEYDLYNLSFETGEFELASRLLSSEKKSGVNVVLTDGMIMVNWVPDSGGLRVLVRDFTGQSLLDTTFEDVSWLLYPTWGLTGYGMDEDYLYFFQITRQFITVPWDGSEIRLLWSKDA